jgi:hypothetical protein
VCARGLKIPDRRPDRHAAGSASRWGAGEAGGPNEEPLAAAMHPSSWTPSRSNPVYITQIFREIVPNVSEEYALSIFRVEEYIEG